MSERKFCPILGHAIATSQTVKSGTDIANAKAASMCIENECQLWWFCSGRFVERLDAIRNAVITVMAKSL